MDDLCACTTTLSRFHHRGVLGLAIAAAFAALLPSGCKGFGQNKDSVVSDPPRRKPNAIAAAPGQSARPAGGPVRLDGSAANDAGAAPNAPGIEGAPVLAGPATNDGAPAAGTTHGALNAGAAANRESSAESPSADDEGLVLPTTAEEETSTVGAVVHADDLREAEAEAEFQPGERDGWTVEAEQEATGAVKRRIEFEDNGTKVAEGEVAAFVNGVPIFSDDIIKANHAEAQLQAVREAVAQKGLPPEEFRKWRRQFIEHRLGGQIEQELLIHELRKKLKEEQITGMTKQIDQMFEKEFLPEQIKNAKVHTRGELEFMLQKQGSSLDVLRANFRNRQMASAALGSKTQVHEGFDRPDVLKYYKEHLKDYTVPGKVKWDQIQIRIAKRSDKAATQKKVAEIMARLKKGEDFAAVAKECSNGPNAAKGGRWGWTTQGTLAEREIDAALFERKVGEIGPPIEAAKSIHIVRVVDRQAAAVQPFEDVQEDIKNQLQSSLRQQRINEYVKELRQSATIQTFTDRL